ncbi:YybH family protein [Sutcliffiella horikoshii]|uniref:YybH family protein n=1 Tax=Sutcliffiella horikoshii TaxID=79883 RepID=UPI001F348A21|nr:nuclear transport factor 2 family protein [Sutcliffiella horikoshii]MCG1023618.1 DUF4440 domain-containing protein [Sutcliffiella horikoshii]
MSYQTALNQYIKATNTHNFDQVEKLLHANVVYWFTNKSCTTMEEIRAFFEKAWDTIKEEVYSAKDVQWIAVDEHTATCLYTFHYEGYMNGEFISGSGRATNVFVKEEGQWKLIHEHLSR